MIPGTVRVEPAYDDPAAVRALIERSGPFVPLARDARRDGEDSASDPKYTGFVPPWFRRDMATFGDVHVDGADLLLHNPRFLAAAGDVYPEATIIEPTTVYVNVMGPCAYPFVAHTDVPVFRFASRRNAPPWLLGKMLLSGLFEADRTRLVTAVSWLFAGPGGTFHYWPDGPTGARHEERAPFANVAVVADNERVYHGVGPLGATDAPSPTDLTVDAEIDCDADRVWTIHDPDPVMTYSPADVRITVSWKAEVFDDEAERDRLRALDDDLPLDTIVATFMDDLGSRGIDADEPDDPLTDERWIATLDTAYPSRAPRIPQSA